MSGNSGEQLLKIIVKSVMFILKLLPGLIKAIYKGIMAIVNKLQNKGTNSEATQE